MQKRKNVIIKYGTLIQKCDQAAANELKKHHKISQLLKKFVGVFDNFQNQSNVMNVQERVQLVKNLRELRVVYDTSLRKQTMHELELLKNKFQSFKASYDSNMELNKKRAIARKEKYDAFVKQHEKERLDLNRLPQTPRFPYKHQAFKLQQIRDRFERFIQQPQPQLSQILSQMHRPVDVPPNVAHVVVSVEPEGRTVEAAQKVKQYQDSFLEHQRKISAYESLIKEEFAKQLILGEDLQKRQQRIEDGAKEVNVYRDQCNEAANKHNANVQAFKDYKFELDKLAGGHTDEVLYAEKIEEYGSILYLTKKSQDLYDEVRATFEKQKTFVSELIEEQRGVADAFYGCERAVKKFEAAIREEQKLIAAVLDEHKKFTESLGLGESKKETTPSDVPVADPKTEGFVVDFSKTAAKKELPIKSLEPGLTEKEVAKDIRTSVQDADADNVKAVLSKIASTNAALSKEVSGIAEDISSSVQDADVKMEVPSEDQLPVPPLEVYKNPSKVVCTTKSESLLRFSNAVNMMPAIRKGTIIARSVDPQLNDAVHRLNQSQQASVEEISPHASDQESDDSSGSSGGGI